MGCEVVNKVSSEESDPVDLSHSLRKIVENLARTRAQQFHKSLIGAQLFVPDLNKIAKCIRENLRWSKLLIIFLIIRNVNK